MGIYSEFRAPTLAEFQSNLIVHGGVAKPSRFLVHIPSAATIRTRAQGAGSILTRIVRGLGADPAGIPNALALQCEAAEFPGRTLATADVRTYGPSFKHPYQTTYNDVPLTFMCTNDMHVKKFFDAWMETINPDTEDGVNESWNFAYPNEYSTRVRILQFDEGGDVLGFDIINRLVSRFDSLQANLGVDLSLGRMKASYGVELIDAYPISVNQLGLNWADDNIHRLTVQFAYRYWRRLDINPFFIPNSALNDILTTAGLPAARDILNDIFS